MKLVEQIAKHFRDIHFGGNWTDVNLKDQLANVSWKQATTSVYSFHTVATLVFHMNYFVEAVMKVLQGGPLDAHDRFSFDLPHIESQEAWQELLDKTWGDATVLANLIEQLPENRLWETFSEERYGNYYRNLHGLIEHCHYHLGQIVLIGKIIRQSEGNAR